jgi:hypothetical protein
MGKLLIGHFGRPPEAESVTLTLSECHQRLGLKPSDFVSSDAPPFFHKSKGAKGKYLVFELEVKEVQDMAVWRPGYYLLPLEAADVLKAFSKQEAARRGSGKRPYDIVFKKQPPEDVLDRAQRWADESQPLLIQCRCPSLLLKMDAPWAVRRRWSIKLTCEKRCQPPLKTLI